MQKFCELCWGRNGHGKTNHVYRTMHILDVISSVSRSSKCNKIVGGWDFAPDPTGEFIALPRLLAGFKGPTSKDTTSKGRGGRRQNDPCPRIHSHATDQKSVKAWFVVVIWQDWSYILFAAPVRHVYFSAEMFTFRLHHNFTRCKNVRAEQTADHTG